MVRKEHLLPEGCVRLYKLYQLPGCYSAELGNEATDLIYNTSQRVIYYYRRGLFMTPYYGRHGKLCTLNEKGQIVEIK